MYEAVHARPDGESTVARFARTAADWGYEGIVVRNHGDARAEYDPAAVGEAYGVDVVDGVEIRADDSTQASGYVGNFRPDHAILCLHGGTPALNRFAVEQERVDVLCHPMRGDGDLNHVLVRAARENGVRIEVNLADVLRTSGGPRVQVLQGLRKLRELIDTYEAPYVVSADPFSHLHVRAPRELRALGETIGFDADAIEAGLREWGRLTERNRDRQSESFIEPGVREGRHEEER
ncbi:MAG: ribonuclease P/MRP protein subunit RPP1 [Halobacteriales archaeon]|jgi:ribonuclease P/MRP protein subunit RPP1